MSTIRAKDGTQISYKDWGTGQAVVFSHGWPLNAVSWEDQMPFPAAAATAARPMIVAAMDDRASLGMAMTCLRMPTIAATHKVRLNADLLAFLST